MEVGQCTLHGICLRCSASPYRLRGTLQIGLRWSGWLMCGSVSRVLYTAVACLSLKPSAESCNVVRVYSIPFFIAIVPATRKWYNIQVQTRLYSARHTKSNIFYMPIIVTVYYEDNATKYTERRDWLAGWLDDELPLITKPPLMVSTSDCGS